MQVALSLLHMARNQRKNCKRSIYFCIFDQRELANNSYFKRYAEYAEKGNIQVKNYIMSRPVLNYPYSPDVADVKQQWGPDARGVALSRPCHRPPAWLKKEDLDSENYWITALKPGMRILAGNRTREK